MFRGNALAKIDNKGRLKLPAHFRGIIEPQFGTEFFVTSLRGRSIRIYPMETWKEIENKLAGLPSMDPAVIRFKNSVNYYGQSAAMDAQGRILLHPMLREKANARGEVAILGQQNYLEVWNREQFESQLEEDPLTDDDLQALADRGI
jgi:MraZ protein